MRPINEKERKRSFLRFLGMFLLAIIPICLAVYQFARTNDLEARHYREQVSSQRVVQEKTEEVKMIESNIESKITRLSEVVIQAGQNLSTDYSSEFDFELNKLGEELVELDDKTDEELTDSYIKNLKELRRVLVDFNETVYEILHEENRDLDESLDKCNEDLRECRGAGY